MNMYIVATCVLHVFMHRLKSVAFYNGNRFQAERDKARFYIEADRPERRRATLGEDTLVWCDLFYYTIPS